MKKRLLGIAVVVLFAGLFLWGSYAEASEGRLGLGFGYTANVGSRTMEFMLTSDDLRWYGSVSKIGGDYRHNYQFTRWCGGYRVNWRREKSIMPFMRLGACYFDEPPFDYISSDYAYDLSVGVRLWGVAELELLQHNSTAGRSDQNEGVDGILLGIVFPFGK